MTSVLNVDTVADKAGTGPVSLTKQQAVKAYGNIDAETGFGFTTSFAASSATDNGTGDYTFNMTNNMSDTSYMFTINNHNEKTGVSSRVATVYLNGQAAGSFRFTAGYPSNTGGGATAYDDDHNTIIILGDLA